MLKSEIVEKKAPEEVSYPCLMQAHGYGRNFVALFAAPRDGVVVWSSNQAWDVGERYAEFEMDAFEPFTGTITLSND